MFNLDQILSFIGLSAELLPNNSVEKGSRYHYVIISAAMILGVVFGCGGLILVVWIIAEDEFELDLLFAPIIFGLAGILFGVALTCTFAPSRFLQGRAGRKWMKFIGTESVLTARIATAIFSLIIFGFLGLMAWGGYRDYMDEQKLKQRRNHVRVMRRPHSSFGLQLKALHGHPNHETVRRRYPQRERFGKSNEV